MEPVLFFTFIEALPVVAAFIFFCYLAFSGYLAFSRYRDYRQRHQAPKKGRFHD